MKRMIFTLLAVLMLSSLTACAQAPDAPAQETTGKETTQTTAAASATDTFEEMTLVDDENCTFKITATGTDSIWGYTLKVYDSNDWSADHLVQETFTIHP